jgi:hypothetical protein
VFAIARLRSCLLLLVLCKAFNPIMVCALSLACASDNRGRLAAVRARQASTTPNFQGLQAARLASAAPRQRQGLVLLLEHLCAADAALKWGAMLHSTLGCASRQHVARQSTFMRPSTHGAGLAPWMAAQQPRWVLCSHPRPFRA